MYHSINQLVNQFTNQSINHQSIDNSISSFLYYVISEVQSKCGRIWRDCWSPIHVRSTEILGVCMKHGEPYYPGKMLIVVNHKFFLSNNVYRYSINSLISLWAFIHPKLSQIPIGYISLPSMNENKNQNTSKLP